MVAPLQRGREREREWRRMDAVEDVRGAPAVLNNTTSISWESESDDDDDDDDDDENIIKLCNGNNRRMMRVRGLYSSEHRILLVGEGDFSFSLSLATAFRTARNIVSTTIDSQDLAVKYCKGLRNVRELEEMGGVVLDGVDAEKMSQHFFLTTQRFDRIVYNFPHVGFHYPENNACQIKLNKRLVKGFLKNAKVLLIRRSGEIHVTHKDGDPYDKWDLVKKANKIGLTLLESVPFRKGDYPGYNNKRAHGYFSDAPFPLGNCTTFKFRIAPI